MLLRITRRISAASLLLAALEGCDQATIPPATNTGGAAGAGGEVTGSSASSSSSSTGSGGGVSSSSSGGGGAGGSVMAECSMDSDCAGNPKGALCETSSGVCVECLDDTQCTAGLHCKKNLCVPECSGADPCAPGLSCCNGFCHDLLTDNDHCGTCNQACVSTPDSDRTCLAGSCTMTSCKPYFYDCNASPADGCEQIDTTNPCVCTPGMVRACYAGAPGTQDVGACASGTQTCKASGTEWTSCQGQVLPQWEVCNNQVDDDCNGLVDDDPDADGDGWTICSGDCGEKGQPGIFRPELVNPGAMELIGNGIDDDCDPMTLDTVAPLPCLSNEKLTNVMAADLVQAMDLCQFATENAPLPVRKWGVIDAQFLRPDGTVPNAAEMDDMRNAQAAVLEHYGNFNDPIGGTTVAGLSTGMMRDVVHHAYGGSTAFSSSSNLPADILAEYGGMLPHPPACAAISSVRDGINLRVRVRVPTNAFSLDYLALFGTAEDSQTACVPADDFALGTITPRPLAFPSMGWPLNTLTDTFGWPFSVNSAYFDHCEPSPARLCPDGPMRLSGTPMKRLTNFVAQEISVNRGEIMTLDFMIFDADDAIVDSVLLLDDFSFSPSTASSCLQPANDPRGVVGQTLHCHP